MSTALIRVLPGRPATVFSHGTTVYLSIHDAYHLSERKAWKRRLAERHPDSGGAVDRQRFRKKHGAYRAWLQRELSWYHGLGLEPPTAIKDTKKPEPPQPKATCVLCPRTFTPKPGQQPPQITCGKACGAKLSAQRRHSHEVRV